MRHATELQQIASRAVSRRLSSDNLAECSCGGSTCESRGSCWYGFTLACLSSRGVRAVAAGSRKVPKGH